MSGKILKVICLAICVAILMSLFVGCGGKGETAEMDKKAATVGSKEVGKGIDEKIKMRFWMRAASKQSVTGRLVEKYNKENTDNVELEFEVYGENYKNVINIACASGNPPDVFELNGGLMIPQLAEAKYILPLDKYVDDDFKKNFYPEVFMQKQFYYSGKLYTIPERSAFFRLVYNRDIFKKAGIAEPPGTLEELKAYAKKITEEGKGEFYGFGAALKTNSSWGRFTDNICTISGLTGEYGFDWKTGWFDFTKQKKALEFLISLEKEKCLFPGAIMLDIEVARAQFGQGKFAMMIDGNWQVAQFGNGEIKCTVNWDSAPIPVFKVDKKGKSFMFFDMGKLIAEKTPDPDKAWNFIKFLLDNQSEYVKVAEPLRTTIKANDKANIPANYNGIKGFTDIENSRAFPLQVHSFLKLEGDNRDKVYAGIFIGGIEIDKGLADLNARYNAALEKAIKEGVIKEGDIKIPNVDY